MKDISVVIPVYNGAEYLKDCVQSVFDAGKRITEIIIVDDGSTDGTLETADDLAADNPKIRVIHTDNHGSYMARVTGIRAAKTAYIAFIDVDDQFFPGSLDLLAEILEQNDADISFGGIVETADRDVKFISHPTEDYYSIVHTPEDIWPRIMKWRTQEFLLYIWHKIYKKELFDGLPEVDGICQGDDVILTCKAFLDSGKIVETTAPVYLYYTNPDGLTHKGFSDSDLDLIRVWDTVVDMTDSARNRFYIDPSLAYLAQYNRWRTDFTLITRLVLSDNKEKDRKYAIELKKWRRGLKNHWWDLVSPHAIPVNREILIIALRFFYTPTKILMRLAKRLKKANTGIILHNGEKI